MSGRKLKLTCDSGANIHSKNEHIVDDPGILGCDTWEEWDELSETDKFKTVESYWYDGGDLQIGWEVGDE